MMKQQINHEVIQKVRHLHNVIFHSINLCHSLSFYSTTSPVLFTNKLWNEKKKHLYIWLLQGSVYYIKGRRRLYV